MWLIDVADRRNLASINVSRPDLQATKYLTIDQSDKFKISLFKVPSCLSCGELELFFKTIKYINPRTFLFFSIDSIFFLFLWEMIFF